MAIHATHAQKTDARLDVHKEPLVGSAADLTLRVGRIPGCAWHLWPRFAFSAFQSRDTWQHCNVMAFPLVVVHTFARQCVQELDMDPLRKQTNWREVRMCMCLRGKFSHRTTRERYYRCVVGVARLGAKHVES